MSHISIAASSRKRRDSVSHMLSSPRTMLGCVLLFFVMSHTLMMQRTLNHQDRYQRVGGDHHHHEGEDGNGDGAVAKVENQRKRSGTTWREDWKLRRTQSVHERHKHATLQGSAMKGADMRGKVTVDDESPQSSSSSTNDDDDDDDDDDDATIRSWGANLTTTPLIYVHIGKAGGGTIRARFSSARPNFTHKDWRTNDMGATYAVAKSDNATTTTTTTPAYFCNSGHATFRSTPRVLYEPAFVCHATTPLGAMIACPEQFSPLTENCPLGCNVDDESCHQVYMGHNIVGSEFHWLPYRVLQQWWRKTFRPLLSNDMYTTYEHYLETLSPENHDWCPYEGDGLPRPHNIRDYKNKLLTCEVPLAHAVDTYAHRLLAEIQSTTTTNTKLTHEILDPSNRGIAFPTGMVEDWSFVYASLPVLRTTIVREPWSWMVSKFFWMGNWHRHDLECADIVQAVSLDGQSRSGIHTSRRRLQEEKWRKNDAGDDSTEEEEYNQEGGGGRSRDVDEYDGTGDDTDDEEEKKDDDGQSNNRQDDNADRRQRNGQTQKKHVMPLHHPDSTIVTDTGGYGWASRYAMLYILYLCGEDCAARWEMSSAGYDDETLLAQLERQAANNLRRSFAVVGLLQETDTFFDMVTARVQYIDMSIHSDMEGELHDTGTNGYIAQCKETFKDPDFRRKLREACPAMAALERLYDVAVEVNRFQVRELAASPSVDPAVRERLRKAAEQF